MPAHTLEKKHGLKVLKQSYKKMVAEINNHNQKQKYKINFKLHVTQCTYEKGTRSLRCIICNKQANPKNDSYSQEGDMHFFYKLQEGISKTLSTTSITINFKEVLQKVAIDLLFLYELAVYPSYANISKIPRQSSTNSWQEEKLPQPPEQNIILLDWPTSLSSFFTIEGCKVLFERQHFVKWYNNLRPEHKKLFPSVEEKTVTQDSLNQNQQDQFDFQKIFDDTEKECNTSCSKKRKTTNRNNEYDNNKNIQNCQPPFTASKRNLLNDFISPTGSSNLGSSNQQTQEDIDLELALKLSMEAPENLTEKSNSKDQSEEENGPQNLTFQDYIGLFNKDEDGKIKRVKNTLLFFPQLSLGKQPGNLLMQTNHSGSHSGQPKKDGDNSEKPKEMKDYNNLGEHEYNQQRFEDALLIYKESWENYNNYPALVGMAKCYLALKQYEQASQYLTEAINMITEKNFDENSEALLNNLCKLQEKIKQEQEQSKYSTGSDEMFTIRYS
jgi:tetratricopeptide (TPR) repeat protein